MIKELFKNIFNKNDNAENANEKAMPSATSMSDRLTQGLQNQFGKTVAEASNAEVFAVLMQLTKDEMEGMQRIAGDKKLYYISAEFLIGKLLSNNLINLGYYDEIDALLKANGKTLAEVEECENEPSLGNGGLGRLAACFLDSIATLNLPGDGIGLNYHFGLFKQEFADHKQKELMNPWMTKESWLTTPNWSG